MLSCCNINLLKCMAPLFKCLFLGVCVNKSSVTILKILVFLSSKMNVISSPFKFLDSRGLKHQFSPGLMKLILMLVFLFLFFHFML